MYSLARTLTAILLLVPALLWSVPAIANEKHAKAQEIKPTHQWSGSVADESLQKLAPEQEFITDEKEFAKLWDAWKLGDKMPPIDFKKELVLVETTSGSLLHVSVQLTEGGDLRVLGIATRDFLPGFRYQVVVVPREGVKTVNGKRMKDEG